MHDCQRSQTPRCQEAKIPSDCRTTIHPCNQPRGEHFDYAQYKHAGFRQFDFSTRGMEMLATREPETKPVVFFAKRELGPGFELTHDRGFVAT